MIKCEKGNVNLTGSLPDMLAEHSEIVAGLYDLMIDDAGLSPEVAKDLLHKAMEKGIEAVEADSEAAEKAAAEKAAAKDLIIEMLDRLKEMLTGKDEE